MNKRYLLWAIALGLGSTLILFALLRLPVAPVRADPGIYYVRAGADGDCLSTETPCGSIQQAIALSGPGPGDEVWVAAGVYTEYLVISNSVKVHGGWNITFTTRSITGTPVIVDSNDVTHTVRIDAPDEAVTLDGLTLRNGRDGIHVYSGAVTVTACTVEHFARQGIEIDGGPSSGLILLQHNHVRNGDREGIEIDGGVVAILSNTVENVGRHGISVRGGEALVQGNTVQTSGFDPASDYYGIEVSGTHTVVGNVVRDVDDNGIYARGGDASIVDNHVEDVGGDGIRVDADCPSAVIRGNTVYSTANDGIDARAQTNAIISNTLTQIGKDGIHIEGVPEAEIAFNTVYSAASDGIDAEGTGAFTITHNVIGPNVGAEGIKVRDAGDSLISIIQHNRVQQVGDDGIDARAQTNAIAHNVLTLAGKDGVHVENVRDALITFNTVYSAGGDGIDARGARALTITHNVISVTVDGDGIKVQAADQVMIRENRINDVGDDGIDTRAIANTIAHNVVADSDNNGIKAEGTTTAIIEANQVYGSGEAGVDLDDAGVFTLTNNVIANSVTQTILIQTGAAPHNVLYHNTLVGSPTVRQGIGIEINVPGVTLTLVNNIVASHTVGISHVVGSGVVVSNSLLWANEGGTLVLSGTLSIFLDPRFVDPINRDYHLQADSPAIDAGADVGVRVDFEGDPRPMGDGPDIGADEFDLRDEFIYLPLVIRNYASQ
ncbi:MAG TPA: right-handed parallel beta-helix repeat-containing protein [Chloroflexi bacterium]|nr:right-handed parallel beta-helix repeat-containing protein [Chloroflexota bacterium]